VTTPAGWFPDPEDAEGQRFWNGDEWTEHCAPDAPPAVDAARSSPRRAGKGLLVGLGAAVVLVLIVGAVIAVMLTKKADADGVTATPRQAETSAPSQMPAAEIGEEGPTQPQAAGTGEEVRDGDFAFVVNGVRTTDTIGDPEFPELNATAQGEYVIVALTVTNVSADPKTFFASFNTLSDGTTVFEPDDEAWLYLGHTVTDVGPGASLETEVVFDVPRDTDLESIWLRGGPLSEGVAVTL
jgi:hypothetical protein